MERRFGNEYAFILDEKPLDIGLFLIDLKNHLDRYLNVDFTIKIVSNNIIHLTVPVYFRDLNHNEKTFIGKSKATDVYIRHFRVIANRDIITLKSVGLFKSTDSDKTVCEEFSYYYTNKETKELVSVLKSYGNISLLDDVVPAPLVYQYCPIQFLSDWYRPSYLGSSNFCYITEYKNIDIKVRLDSSQLEFQFTENDDVLASFSNLTAAFGILNAYIALDIKKTVD